ncbi:hypothetical protein AB4Z24_18055 [Hyphomicrobium sp. 2TAF46]
MRCETSRHSLVHGKELYDSHDHGGVSRDASKGEAPQFRLVDNERATCGTALHAQVAFAFQNT